jgi:hypothetical protein
MRAVALGCVVVFAAGCRDMAEPPTARDAGRAPVVRRVPRREAVELAPSPGSAPRGVQDNSIIEEPKVGIELAANAIPLFDPHMRYDKTTEVTISGPIVALIHTPLAGDRTGLFVKISAGGETPVVYMGPEEWLFFHDIRPAMTHQLFVTGSRAEMNGQMVIMARKIILNGLEVHLRDANGNPFWTEPIVAPAGEPVVSSGQATVRR